MSNQTTLRKIPQFFLTKIIVGVLVVAGSVFLTQTIGSNLLDRTPLSDDLKNIIVGIVNSTIALVSYILLYKAYEKRRIKELSLANFGKYASFGFLMGLVLQSLAIVILELAGGYSITHINPASFLIPGFMAALTAGFVAEIILRGIIFRLTEEKLGTTIALLVSIVLFAVAHLSSEHATLLSVLSTCVQAGFLISVVYVYTRSLWAPIFFHFAWDLAEPGIYGGINPGISLEKKLLTSSITGPESLTGGLSGPGNSIQATIFCLLAGILILWLARKNANFIKPYWKQSRK